MDPIYNFDKTIVKSIFNDIDLNGFVEKTEQRFVGYKESIDNYFSFFISLYKNQGLMFSFREDIYNKSIKRLYILRDNVDVIKKIIQLIVKKEHISEELYEQYLYEEPVDEMSLDKIQKCDSIIDELMNNHVYFNNQVDNNDVFDKSNEFKVNAGTRWSKEEEDKLIEEFGSGKKISAIARVHGRSRGAIRKRLFRIGLIK